MLISGNTNYGQHTVRIPREKEEEDRWDNL